MVLRLLVRQGIHVDKSELAPRVLKALAKAFRYDNPAHARVRRMGKWTGNVPRHIDNYVENDRVLLLPRGASAKVQEVLRAEGVEHVWIDDRHEHKAIPWEFGPKAEPVEMRPYQEDAIAAALERENCIIRSPTGSGKTEIIADLLMRLKRRAVVVVWTRVLVKEWVERLALRYGWPTKRVGVLGDGKKRIGAEVTVAMQQSLTRAPDETLERFDVLVCDELQRFAASTFRNGVARVPARWRIGVSADERRKDRLEELIHDHFGRVVCDIPRDLLIEKGNICEVEIDVIPTGFRFKPYEDAPSERKEALYAKAYAALEADEDRQHLAARLIAEDARAGHHVWGFVEHAELARKIVQLVTTTYGVPCGLLLGGHENRVNFDDTIARMKAKKLSAAVGTYCIYQGPNVVHLDRGLVISPAASNKQLMEQRVGRLRRPLPGKKPVLRYLWDEFLFPGHLAKLRSYYGARLVQVR